MKCTQCGLCRENCVVYRATYVETASPRGKHLLRDKKKLGEEIWLCTLCDACKNACPLGIEMKMVDDRKIMLASGKETADNKKMIENIRRYGNPFGKIKEGEKPKERYCC